MDEQKWIEKLVHFGLTRQESQIYHTLLILGKATGYEISKSTGISRSNVYNSLNSLKDKGAAYVIEETAKQYIPVPLSEFCGNYISRLKEEEEWMAEHLPKKKEEEEGYITINGADNIRNKIRNLLVRVDERVYFSCSLTVLKEYEEILKELVRNDRKVVVITDGVFTLPGVIIYTSEDKKNQIGLIADSRYVLTGEIGEESTNTCLYSGQKNFVTLFKTALSNEIRLIEGGMEHHE